MTDETQNQTQSQTSNNNTIPPPPRLQGKPEVDLPSISQWFKVLYEALVLQNQFLDTSQQFVAAKFDPKSLPDPASSNIATAQNTANESYVVAANARALADLLRAVVNLKGTVEITGTNTSAAVTFEKELSGAAYEIVAMAKTSSGSPAIGAFVPVGITSQSKTGFTLNIQAAPGSGKSVTYVWFLRSTV